MEEEQSTLRWPDDSILKIINKLLLLVIILANGYVLVLPLVPKIDFAIKQNITKPIKINPSNSGTLSSIDRSYNHLILPTIQLDARVFDGESNYTVNKG